VLAGPYASYRHQGRAARRRGFAWYALEQGIGRARPGPGWQANSAPTRKRCETRWVTTGRRPLTCARERSS